MIRSWFWENLLKNGKIMEIIEKIQKLLKKAENSATTPQEAAIFMAKVQELLLEHKLTMSDLSGSDDDITDNLDPLFEGNNIHVWKSILANVLTKAHGVYCLIKRTHSGNKIVMIGRPSSATIVRCLFAHCQTEIDRLAKSSCKGRGATYANNFRVGAVAAINDAIKEELARQRLAYAGNEKALVIINQMPIDLNNARNFLANQGVRTKNVGQKVRYNEDGRAAGYRAGQGVYNSYGKNRIGYDG
jgi:hypothetical protein